MYAAGLARRWLRGVPPRWGPGDRHPLDGAGSDPGSGSAGHPTGTAWAAEAVAGPLEGHMHGVGHHPSRDSEHALYGPLTRCAAQRGEGGGFPEGGCFLGDGAASLTSRTMRISQ